MSVIDVFLALGNLGGRAYLGWFVLQSLSNLRRR